jgi:hypothetical protein
VPAGSDRLDRRRHYYGASLAALTALSEERGYRLVGCDSSGTNAFFVRRELASELPTRRPEEAFRTNLNRRDDKQQGTFLADLAADGFELVEV